MVFAQLENLLTENGFNKVPSNLPEFAFFFRKESTYVNVVHVIDTGREFILQKVNMNILNPKLRIFFSRKE